MWGIYLRSLQGQTGFQDDATRLIQLIEGSAGFNPFFAAYGGSPLQCNDPSKH